MRQRLDRVGEHVAARLQDVADDRRRDAALGDLDRCLDHRQRETLDAETVALKVPPFRLQEPRAGVLRVRVVAEQRLEARLGEAEELLVLPERIVGVEADGGQALRAGRHGAPYRAEMLRSRVEPLEERCR